MVRQKPKVVLSQPVSSAQLKLLNNPVGDHLSSQTVSQKASFNLELLKEDTDHDGLYAGKRKTDMIHITKDLRNELQMLKAKKNH